MFHVSDVQKACDWYSRLLSIKPVYLLDDFSVLRIGNTEICFHKADSKVSSGKSGVVTYWRVADFSKAVARAEKMGGEVHRGPLEIEDGYTICQIADPFGNLFGLVGPETVKT
jgi:predicted enzyme related to lactoylglutathione lyase